MNANSISSMFTCLAAGALVAIVSACVSNAPPSHAFFPFENLRGVIFTPPQVLADAQRPGLGQPPNAIVLAIDERNSYRAVANAVARVRERGLAVGYWIELSKAPTLATSSDEFSAQLQRVHDLLANFPPADAIFLSGLQGAAAACDCGSLECYAADSPAVNGAQQNTNVAARFVTSVRTFASGAIVVPVWLDGCAPRSSECEARHCKDADCEANATLAWNAMRADSSRVALSLRNSPLAQPAGADASIWPAARLRAWMRQPPTTLPSTQIGATTLVAVLSAAEFSPAELARAVASVQFVRRTGLLLDYTPPPSSEH